MKIQYLVAPVSLFGLVFLLQVQHSRSHSDVRSAIKMINGSLQVQRSTPATKTSEPVSGDMNENTFSRYANLKKKALLSAEEWTWLERELSDPHALEEATRLLTQPAKSYSYLQEQRRFVAIDFLIEAMNLATGMPDSAAEAVESVIVAENLRVELDFILRKSLIGDKLELFTHLAERFPERAKHLHQRSRGTILETILNQAMS